MSNNLFKKWLKNPFQYGSVIDSSPQLAAKLISYIPHDAKAILEFGAGAGPITEALSHSYDPKTIVSFELDPELAQKVIKRVPHVRVINDDVTKAAELIPESMRGKVDVIISSLPLLNLPDDVIENVFKSAKQVLSPTGVMIQFTYLPFLSPTHLHANQGFEAYYKGVVVRNFPPAFIWIYRMKSS